MSNQLSLAERLDLVNRLFSRNDLGRDGREAFLRAYPTAPESMRATAAFHVYVDGCEALLDFLADAERFLQNPENELDQGKTFHVLYHLYNWLQFQALLPEGKQSLVNLLGDLKQFVDEDDRDAIRQAAQAIKEVIEADQTPPAFD
jgi:hypothetical protein